MRHPPPTALHIDGPLVHLTKVSAVRCQSERIDLSRLAIRTTSGEVIAMVQIILFSLLGFGFVLYYTFRNMNEIQKQERGCARAYLGTMISILVSLFILFAAGGWVFLGLIFLGILPIGYICHATIHAYALKRSSNEEVRYWVFVSNAVLILISFFYRDRGDGSDWLAITALFGSGKGYVDTRPPAFIEKIDVSTYDALLLLPLFLTWAIVFLRSGGPVPDSPRFR
jgi:hypothetical protein